MLESVVWELDKLMFFFPSCFYVTVANYYLFTKNGLRSNRDYIAYRKELFVVKYIYITILDL